MRAWSERRGMERRAYDQRMWEYTAVYPERRQRHRRTVLDRRKLYANSLRGIND